MSLIIGLVLDPRMLVFQIKLIWLWLGQEREVL